MNCKRPLAAVPDIMVDGARKWFDTDPWHFAYDGARLVASVFPDLSAGLDARLAALIAGGNEEDLGFVLGILSAFEGKACVFELVRAVVATLDPRQPIAQRGRSVLDQSGVIRGEFGGAELNAERKASARAVACRRERSGPRCSPPSISANLTCESRRRLGQPRRRLRCASLTMVRSSMEVRRDDSSKRAGGS